MVYSTARKRKTLKRHRRNTWIALLIIIAILVFCLVFLLLDNGRNAGLDGSGFISFSDDAVNGETDEEKTDFKKIDFQNVIDEWAKNAGGSSSVAIYDLDLGQMAGEKDINEQYSTASLYKLFVVYEGYLKLQSGEWDGSSRAGSTGHTILECLDLSIRASDSSCAETIWSMIGRDELDEIAMNKFGAKNTSVSSLFSTPADILRIMKVYYLHSEITDDNLISLMKDSFLNQPTAEYDWRQGLPSGFDSSRVNVYNKVGWDYNENGYWNTYHDAAIIEFPEQDRHFVVVVMTSGVSFQSISKLGTAISEYFFAHQ